MASEYDVFHVIAAKGELKINDILKELNKPKEDYQQIFNSILVLEKKGYVERKEKVRVVNSEKSKKLFDLISFCLRNNMNYNLIFKPKMLLFLEKASKKNSFSINDIRMHPQTFKLYTDALSRYGFLLILSKKPLKCKLLRHHFIIETLSFFKKNPKFYEENKSELIPQIIKELKIYYRNRRIHPHIFEKIENNTEANFIYTSLSLEGNPMTLPQTQKLIFDKVVPKNQSLEAINEISNYKKAMDMMIKLSAKKIRISLEIILKYHLFAMQHKDHAGKIRKVNVFIKTNPDFKTAHWKEINPKLENLMKRYDDFESRKRTLKEVFDFAAYFHNEFQRIHPFVDGNSRLSRLLMLNLLRMHKMPLISLPLGYFDLYLNLTKRSKKRDDQSLKYLIEEITLMELKRINLNNI